MMRERTCNDVIDIHPCHAISIITNGCTRHDSAQSNSIYSMYMWNEGTS